MVRATLFGWLALLCVGAAPAWAGSPCKGRSLALVVGVSNYQNPGISGLNSAAKDAKQVAEALTRQGYKVVTLLDKKATRDNIRKVLGMFIERSKPDDRLLVYFAGHGVTMGGKAGGDVAGYLAPVDFDPKLTFATGISMQEVVKGLHTAGARKRLFVADACYSGLALPTYRKVSRADAINPSRCPTTDDVPVTAAIVAGSKSQVAHETSTGGVFTKVFLDVLAGRTKADQDVDGWISHQSLGWYLRSEVKRRVKTAWNKSQVPQLAYLGDGDYLLQVAGPTHGRAAAKAGSTRTVTTGVGGTAAPVADEGFQYPWTVSLAATAVVGAALGAVFYGQLSSAKDEANTARDNNDSRAFDAAYADAETARTLQIASYALGGLAAAGAVAAFFYERRPAEAPGAVRLQVGPGVVGLQGQF